jgi:hypothetical protein
VCGLQGDGLRELPRPRQQDGRSDCHPPLLEREAWHCDENPSPLVLLNGRGNVEEDPGRHLARTRSWPGQVGQGSCIHLRVRDDPTPDECPDGAGVGHDVDWR